jgi:hypothetical protein
MAAYHVTLPSFLAASISAGVTASAAGAWLVVCARSGVAATKKAAAEPLNTLRLDNRIARLVNYTLKIDV